VCSSFTTDVPFGREFFGSELREFFRGNYTILRGMIAEEALAAYSHEKIQPSNLCKRRMHNCVAVDLAGVWLNFPSHGTWWFSVENNRLSSPASR